MGFVFGQTLNIKIFLCLIAETSIIFYDIKTLHKREGEREKKNQEKTEIKIAAYFLPESGKIYNDVFR